VGSFLTLSPEFCFVVEDEHGICGYLLGAPDCRQFEKKVNLAWIPDLCSKYAAPVEKVQRGDKLSGVEQIIHELHEQQTRQKNIPICVYNSHPSICRLGLLEHVVDTSVPKRLMSCLLAALKSNGNSYFQ
jgi:protein O-GlcNAcase/histone acetyltransferase